MNKGRGPVPARVMLIGEAYGDHEERAQEPFVGAAGAELNKLLHEAGFMRSECYLSNVVNARPPQNDFDRWYAAKKSLITPQHIPYHNKWVLPIVREGVKSLEEEISLVNPQLIIAFGNWPLWALTGEWGVLKWRGSMLSYRGRRLIPTIHPSAIIRQWELRAPTLQDLRRARRELDSPSPEPVWNFRVRPTFEVAIHTLHHLENLLRESPLWLDLDLETRHGHIDSCGISWSPVDAICIPFMVYGSREGYWNQEEEAIIVWHLYQILTHPNVKVRWQNGLYDAQYIYRHWHFLPRGAQDTMISQHTMFPGLKKSLDYQASMYCKHYTFWKDDNKEANEKADDLKRWKYNCTDCVRTREVGASEQASIHQMGLESVEAFQQQLFWPVLQAMIWGVRIDHARRDSLILELQDAMSDREMFFANVLGHTLNPNSSAQMKKLFYDDLNQPPILSRPKKNSPPHITCDDEALTKIAKREPILRPIVEKIREYRSLGVFLSTFVMAKLDIDGRMRCSYNICGTETYRLSSSENAFGSGTNLQNLPKGDESGLFPNIRQLYIPDPGYTFFDMDLDRADAQVVAWEADEVELKAALRAGVDLHLLNAYALAGRETPDLEWLVEGHPEYARIRGEMKAGRQLAKSWVHGTNYGGSARTMAIAAGITVAESERAQKLYFGKYPGIKKWHQRTEESLHRTKSVSNAFGYRRHYFERVDGLLPEALAWIPQSTVACVINRAWVNIHNSAKRIMVLLQVHDSLAGQFPTHLTDESIALLSKLSRITIPYPDPLIIPTGIKTSLKSWGDCA